MKKLVINTLTVATLLFLGNTSAMAFEVCDIFDKSYQQCVNRRQQQYINNMEREQAQQMQREHLNQLREINLNLQMNRPQVPACFTNLAGVTKCY